MSAPLRHAVVPAPAPVLAVALLLLVATTAATADGLRQRPDAVPLPQAPSSLPPPPWAAYGAAAYGWPAVGLVVVNPYPALPAQRWRDPDFDAGDGRRSAPPYREDPNPDADPDTAPPPVRW
ncbi:MAG: hypothetical protein C0434_15075 [Xanthomonadaceae bacterium]|nr:hypothetical protein [Xanthomonadaceae bacterium]